MHYNVSFEDEIEKEEFEEPAEYIPSNETGIDTKVPEDMFLNDEEFFDDILEKSHFFPVIPELCTSLVKLLTDQCPEVKR